MIKKSFINGQSKSPKFFKNVILILVEQQIFCVYNTVLYKTSIFVYRYL